MPPRGIVDLDDLSAGGELRLRRGVDRESGRSVLVLTPVSETPSPSTLARIGREHAMRDQLDPSWAAVPLRLDGEGSDQHLVIADPGGRPLDGIVEQSPLSPSTFLDVAGAVVSAVGGMHEAGVVHRDLEPSHVLFDPDARRAALTGFGRATSRSSGQETPASHDEIGGSFVYLAPEQTGRMNRPVDSRSDLYSLGVILYQLLTGELPFAASEPLEWIHAHVAREPAEPRSKVESLPEPLAALVLRLLAKNAEERYQTAAGLEADLARLRAQWAEDGRLDAFPLGTNDTPARWTGPQTLYGRERELGLLRDALERVVTTGIPELAMVSGYSGIGKSSLVHEAMKTPAAEPTLFLVGKYDQNRQDIPFSTMGQAFGGLVRRILRESPEAIESWREAITASIGSSGRVLVDLIPELEWLIGPQPEVLELGPLEARNRFQAVFRRFIRVVATAEHPLVLLIDDLQWIDSASLALLGYMATQRDVRHVFLIGAYRDNEVGPTHRLMLTLEKLRQAKTIVNEVSLEPLGEDEVLRLVAEATLASEEAAAPLARLVHQKTGGNPFFALQLLSSLAEERLLTFDREARRWTADVDEVAALGSSDSVADLMVGKLKRLSPATVETLKRFACLGREATLSTLALLDGSAEPGEEGAAEDTVAGHLEEAIRAGLVTLSLEHYRFAHDRIREAAASLIPDGERPAWHLRIGRVLLAYATADTLEEQLFDIVDHLNQGADLIDEGPERQRLCGLDRAAGRRARGAIAYAAARSYFEQARRLLAADAWEASYESTLALHLDLLECEWVAGSPERAAELFRELVERCASDLDRAEVLRRWMRLHQGIGRAKEALAFGLEALALLGVEFPESDEELLAAFLEEQKAFHQRLDGRRVEALDELPEATDPTARAVMSLLAVAGACAYNARPALTPLIYCRALNTALEWGNTPATCMTYISFGSFLVSRGDIPGAAAFAELGLRLNERFGDLEQRGTLLYVQGAHVNLWQRHIATSLPIHEEGFRVDQEVGNLVFANFNASAIATINVEMGRELDEVIRVSRRYAAFSLESRNEPVRQWIRVAGQLALNLKGETDAPTTLDGGGFTEVHCLEVSTRGNFYTGIANLHLTRMVALVFHQRFEEALEAAKACRKTINALRSGPLEATYHFFHALVLASLCPSLESAADVEAEGEGRGEVFAELAKKEKKLAFWAEHNPHSYRNRHALVAAEIARLEGRELDAMRLYDEAIDSAEENGFVQNVGLAGELAARFYAACGFGRNARAHRRVALDAYRRWGATALVERIERSHPEAATPDRAASSASAASSSITRLEELDLATVLKASQAVSDEIVLDRLIEKLLEIAIEDAGADRGLLLLVEEGTPILVAEAIAQSDGVSVDLCRSQVDGGALPVAALSYVTRTHERVLVDDAQAENPFADDPYFAQHRPRSILCLPLLKQGVLAGALYLENRLAPGVFGPGRTAIVEVLAAQAAISLENAALYADLQREQTSIRELNASLEQRVAERTADLDRVTKLQQQILEQLAERTRDLEKARDSANLANRSKSEFLANMSHEIRTPINAITGFTTLALRTGLDDRQSGYLNRIQAAAHGLLRIIDDLLDLSKIEAGHLDMERIPFRIADVLGEVAGQFEAIAEEKGIEFSTHIEGEVPGELVGDPLRLGQVLLNLCSNAFKFTEQGEVELSVRLAELTDDRARLEIAVRDTGVGLDQEQSEKLFRAFSQADASITRRFGGTGLGLVICKRLVDLMNGRIWLESERGVGTTFHFEAELGRVTEEGLAPVAPAPAVVVGEPLERLRGARLLVIEDNAINQEIARELLEHEGATVTLAEDGRRALEAIEREGVGAFDAALVDLQMPEMDGYEVTRRIRALPGGDGLPLIALTAHAMREERARCLSVGMQDHVAKPVDPDLMVGKLVHWIGEDGLTRAATRWEPAVVAVAPRAGGVPAELYGVDVEAGVARCSGNRGLYRELLEQFRDRHATVATEIDQLVREGDGDGARKRAHEVKGVAANLGMVALASLASDLERSLARDRPGTRRLLSRFAEELEAVVAGLDVTLPSPEPSKLGTPSPRRHPGVAGELEADEEPLVGELVACLERGDLRAEELLRQLRARASGREPEWLADAAVALGSLDFEAALEAVRRREN